MDQNKFAKIYTDIVNGERLLTDYDFCFKDPNLGHGFTEHANGMIWEVVGKRAPYFRNSIAPDHPHPLSATFPWDLVSFWDLHELKRFDKDKLRAYMDSYLAKLHDQLVEYQEMTEFIDDPNSSFMVYKDLLTASPSFMPNIELVIEFIGNQLHELRVFTAQKAPKGSLVFQYKDRPNTLMYFSFGLEGKLRCDTHLQFGISIEPDQFVYGNQEKSESWDVDEGDSEVDEGDSEVDEGDLEVDEGDSEVDEGDSEVDEGDSEVDEGGFRVEPVYPAWEAYPGNIPAMQEVDEDFSAMHLSMVAEATSGLVPMLQGWQGRQCEQDSSEYFFGERGEADYQQLQNDPAEGSSECPERKKKEFDRERREKEIAENFIPAVNGQYSQKVQGPGNARRTSSSCITYPIPPEGSSTHQVERKKDYRRV